MPACQEHCNVRKGINPSAALVKATLINGATEMSPGQYASPQEIPARPNSIEGWEGSILETQSFHNHRGLCIHWMSHRDFQQADIQTTATMWALSITPLRVTLVWTDYPASTGSGNKLVNNLDLTVTGPNSTVYRGNGTVDNKNNVEGVEVTNPTPGFYTVKVSGTNIPYGPQPYALVTSGAIANVQPAPRPTLASAKALPDGSVVTLTGMVVSAGSDQFKDCLYVQELDRSSGIKVQYGTGGGPVLSKGTIVNVIGKLSTVAGERVLIDPIISQ